MNIRKNIDYSELYAALDVAMEKGKSQMELYFDIGKAVCMRTEKGAAVMASEYLNKQYPDVKGFSPRSLRRMRDLYRTYENYPALLSVAMQIGWTQNVVIMEADLTMELREWYLKAAKQFGWSKAELIANIAANTHENIVLDIEEEKKPSNHHDMVIKSKIVLFAALIWFPNNLLMKYWNLWRKGSRRRGILPILRFQRNIEIKSGTGLCIFSNHDIITKQVHNVVNIVLDG